MLSLLQCVLINASYTLDLCDTKKSNFMKKVILITGASSGIGKDAAIALIGKGYTVYAAARRLDKMQDIEQLGGFPLEMDVTNADDVKKIINHIVEKEGRIDVLWNNAGYALYGAVEDVPIEEAKKQFNVNVFGLANMTQEVLPYMRKQGTGTIINTSSAVGKIYLPIGAWYIASKHAVEGFSDSLRLEVKEFNIKVVILEPGAIATEFGDVLFEPLVKFSGNGAYSRLANMMAAGMKASYQTPGGAASPKIVSDTILEIVETEQPEIRYLVGEDAKMMVQTRTAIGDKQFDDVILSQFK